MNIIVAACKNRGIGYKNAIPWHIRRDLLYFKWLTKNKPDNAIVMGKNTWNSIGTPLPGRKNIIVSSSLSQPVDPEPHKDKVLVKNLVEMEQYIHLTPIRDVWVIGGGEIYKNMINNPNVKAIYYTDIFNEFKCDTFFPLIPNHFKCIYRSAPYNQGGLMYNFKIYKNLDYPRISQSLIMDYKDAISKADGQLNKYNSDLWKSKVMLKREPINKEEKEPPKIKPIKKPLLKRSWSVYDKGEHKTSWTANKK